MSIRSINVLTRLYKVLFILTACSYQTCKILEQNGVPKYYTYVSNIAL